MCYAFHTTNTKNYHLGNTEELLTFLFQEIVLQSWQNFKQCVIRIALQYRKTFISSNPFVQAGTSKKWNIIFFGSKEFFLSGGHSLPGPVYCSEFAHLTCMLNGFVHQLKDYNRYFCNTKNCNSKRNKWIISI